MKIRIIRLSALESAIARFDSWWDARAPRERTLLSVLGVLIGGIILVYGVIFPLQNARAKAYADIRTYETLNARIRAAGSLSPQRAPPRTGEPDEVIGNSARAMGLTVNVEEMSGEFRAILTDANYDTVIAWLADLGATSQLKIVSATFSRGSAPGKVNVAVQF